MLGTWPTARFSPTEDLQTLATKDSTKETKMITSINQTPDGEVLVLEMDKSTDRAVLNAIAETMGDRPYASMSLSRKLCRVSIPLRPTIPKNEDTKTH
jgi:hypothetical protein